MRKKEIHLAYYKAANGMYYMATSRRPYHDEFNLKPSRDESFRRFEYEGDDNVHVRIESGTDCRNCIRSPGNCSVIIYLGYSYYSTYLDYYGHRKFRAVCDAIMSYNTRYSNNSELEEDLYIHRFPDKERMKIFLHDERVHNTPEL